jgi:hypothetical protein
MIIACLQAIPVSLWLFSLYIAISAYSSLFKRIVWAPIACGVPVIFLAIQFPLVIQLPYLQQLGIALLCGLGVALGSSFLQPRIVRIFTRRRFEIEGDLIISLLLVVLVMSQLLAASGTVWCQGDVAWLTFAGAAIGTIVPAILFGRGCVLFVQSSGK